MQIAPQSWLAGKQDAAVASAIHVAQLRYIMVMRTTSTSFRLPNHVLGRLRHLATDVGCNQSELIRELVNTAVSDDVVREKVRARVVARGLLDGIADEYGGDAKLVFQDEGAGNVSVRINGNEPSDLKAVVVEVEHHPDLRVMTLYHRALGLRLQPRMPAATYPDEPGATVSVVLGDLYPD